MHPSWCVDCFSCCTRRVVSRVRCGRWRRSFRSFREPPESSCISERIFSPTHSQHETCIREYCLYRCTCISIFIDIYTSMDYVYMYVYKYTCEKSLNTSQNVWTGESFWKTHYLFTHTHTYIYTHIFLIHTHIIHNRFYFMYHLAC